MPARAAIPGLLVLALAAPVLALVNDGPAKADDLDLVSYYPEGPTVIGKTLYWAEMAKDRVRGYRDGKAETVWERPGCGPTAVRPTRQGDIWLLCHMAHEIVLVSPDWETKGTFQYDADGNRLSRPNDGKVAADGTLFFSSSGEFSLAAPANGYLVAIRPDGEAHRVAGPFRYANGVAIAPDGKSLFLSEHLARRVWRLDLEGATVTGQRVYFDFAEAGLQLPEFPLAGPDGQWLSPEGDLYVAEYGAGRIIRIGKDGRLVGTLPVKTPYVTSMIPSPVHPARFAVTGTFDIYEESSLGAVYEVPMSSLAR